MSFFLCDIFLSVSFFLFTSNRLNPCLWNMCVNIYTHRDRYICICIFCLRDSISVISHTNTIHFIRSLTHARTHTTVDRATEWARLTHERAHAHISKWEEVVQQEEEKENSMYDNIKCFNIYHWNCGMYDDGHDSVWVRAYIHRLTVHISCAVNVWVPFCECMRICVNFTDGGTHKPFQNVCVSVHWVVYERLKWKSSCATETTLGLSQPVHSFVPYVLLQSHAHTHAQTLDFTVCVRGEFYMAPI